MKKAIYLYIMLCLCCILAECGGGSMPQELRAVDAVVNEHPDSALAMLDRLESQRDGWGEPAGGQLVTLIYIYTERGELEKARETINILTNKPE